MLVNQKKTDQLVRRFEAYLREALGLDSRVAKWPGEKTLPLYLRELYVFYRARLNAEVLLLVPKTGDEQSPATLAKHMNKIREKWDHDLVFVNEAVSSLTRKRMIEQKIPFVIPGNQMYLPMLGVDLREYFRKMQSARTALSPATQVLILDALYHPKIEADTPTVSAKRFGVSTMTMTRAFDELDHVGLGEHTVNGKERRLRFPGKPIELWEAALPFLKSPVKKTTYIGSHLPSGNRLKSGLSALAEYSYLSQPETGMFAVEADEFRRIRKTEIQEWTRSPGPESMGIELWSYPPSRFGRKGVADPLSVYLSLKEDGDERVQAALKDLLKGMKWRGWV